MNDIVRYDVYSPERDRREFRYLFPAVFLYFKRRNKTNANAYTLQF